MAANPRAGQPAQPEDLIDLPHLVTAYYSGQPDPENVDQQVVFGTSGHRGSSLDAAFNEDHILATTQAIVEYRAAQGTTGPLFIGRDTHGLSEPAWVSALEVLAANDVVAMIDSADRYTPTPAVSHAILAFNRGRDADLADGIVVTPSHNPPRDGGFKYNPPNGGPADTDATSVIAKRANDILRDGLREVPQVELLSFARLRLDDEAAAAALGLPPGEPVTIVFGGDIHYDGPLGDQLRRDPSVLLAGIICWTPFCSLRTIGLIGSLRSACPVAAVIVVVLPLALP